ncbi:MAG: fluoride efflux transporter CrcB [Chitinophagaceae bacterium]|jgi:CrcB protein|nr:fluoride efflux transporter CrcB [Chitinophagaceae bacterium]
MLIKSFLLVAAGGAIGAVLRYATSLVAISKAFPLATFIVNIAGSFLIGILLALSLRNNISAGGWKFLAVGICGGFTTFSALSLEGFQLLQQQRYLVFLLYFVMSIAGGLAATYAGYYFTQ